MTKKNINILIIDDNIDDQEICIRALNKSVEYNFNIITTDNSNYLFDTITKNNIHCIILDYLMPGLTGMDILSKVNGSRFKIPVIFLTGQGNQLLAAEAIREGAENYVVKAQVSNQLLDVVEDAIRKKGEEVELAPVTSRRIILIDDSEEDRELIKRLINKQLIYEYKIQEFQSGAEFFREAMQIEDASCILLDYSLPGSDGIYILNQIRQLHRFLPVILMTGQGSETIAVSAIKEGAQNYLVKSSMTTESLCNSINLAIDQAVYEHEIAEKNLKIQQQVKALSQLASDLKRTNHELESFTYIASHDLRSPLVNLKGFSVELSSSIDRARDLIEKHSDKLPPEDLEELNIELYELIPESIHYIINSAEKMDRLTDSILDLSRIGRRELKPEKLAADELVQDCLKAFEHQLDQYQIDVHCVNLPYLFADRVSLEQIFSNIIDNVVKYYDKDKKSEVKISSWDDSAFHYFSVQDNGIGIKEEDTEKVFQIFRRFGENKDIPGDGMGMPFVKKMVERHGGEIWLESKWQEGTTFFFTIPKEVNFDGKNV